MRLTESTTAPGLSPGAAIAKPLLAEEGLASRRWVASAWSLTGVAGALVIGWIAVIFLVDRARFVALSPELQAGVAAASGFARLFGALVLFLVPLAGTATRLRWIAAGISVLGLGGLLFGFLYPLLDKPFSVDAAIYVSTWVGSLAALLFIVGLLPRQPPPATGRVLAAIAVFALASIAVVFLLRNQLPVLLEGGSLEDAATRDLTYLSGLSRWYWRLAIVQLALSGLALFAAVQRHGEVLFGGWLVLAMTLFAGSQLHNLFWPSVYSPILTTSSVLRLAFAAVIAVAGVVGLHQIATERGRLAAERASLLETAQEYGRRLTELAVLRADFTAMVAHELGTPIAAIRRCAEALGSHRLDDGGRQRALATIEAETELLASLVADVQAIASVERDDFDVRLRPVPVDALVADALAFARTLPGNHSISATRCLDRVRADPDRLGQVLRNLLTNAAKYSPDGAPIEVRIVPAGRRVRFEVVDRGIGIHPADFARIFEKFGRGRDRLGRQQHGVGLGLYVCQRIVKAHGGEVTARSSLGTGSTFAFELERVG
jgi:signal transduction histidine kinase